ncbi:hypothetical protein FPRO04_14257 [Fusarium proliferatum]|uniref:Uncharacterized protein n=1 Tax=Fusarium oxysporum f. sp. radicis-cucumerinum TaxID=327505 RepID=A0A2H3FN50_FUSOX|nr:hypothetical protein FPRO04_14257 [Fusarium proliferatum]PCD21161.1 hypothetical protein AU210_016587 [Fusarium oxysporum f. sp. radicis-cucumerinum]
MSPSTASIDNSLDFNVIVYDSFSAENKTNYFGTLTSLATVPAKTKASVKLIHPIATLIVSNATTNSPLTRFIYIPGSETGPFAVRQADVEAMDETMKFITFIIEHPNDSLTVGFQALLKRPQVTAINKFFTQHPSYARCTFTTYMMGITYIAEQPASKSKPLDQAVYSLSTLVDLLGGTWPSDFPDIVVTKFTCNTKNEVLAIRAGINLKKLPAQSDEALQFFGSLFDVEELQVALSINYSFGLNLFGTRLSISLDAMHVPFGVARLTINKSTVTIDINPLFKFVVFTVTGDIPFNIFGKSFEADVSMVIDNIEANFGIVIKGDNASLPAPPVMKGVHFDSFGVGIGIIFEPPGAAIGLSGQLHIGDAGSGTQVALDDDKFVVVCELVEEVPNPLYISFYVPQMHLADVLTVFTDAPSPFDVPVTFTDLSFLWSENPMEPVALPDGSLSNMGYGFSAAANILGFSFYGDLEINLNNGLTADIEMAPLSFNSIFSVGGDGTGVSIKVDASGNPIKNNLLATTAAQQKALKDATMKQLVPPGGPVLKLQTSASPFLHLNGAVSLFEVAKVQLDADITSSGIMFEVDFGSILTSKISCALADFHNLAASFQYGINQTISLPSVVGVSLGSIHLQEQVGVHFTVNTSSSDLILQVGGSFDFEGLTRNFGDFTADVHIQRVSDLLSAIATNIEQNAEQLFSDLLSTGVVWAGKVKQEVITGVDSVANVLHNAYNQDAAQVASTMRDVGYDAQTIAGSLQTAFGLSEIALAQAMQQAGYTAQEVASALKNVFGSDARQIASAIQGAYGWSADQIHGVLSDIGFTADQIGQAFQLLGGDFAQVGRSILDALNPSNCILQ